MSRKATARLRARLYSNADRLNRGEIVAPRGGSFIRSWRSAATRTFVAVYTAEDAGLDPASPWYASCETHGTSVGCDTKTSAIRAARESGSFCDGCRAKGGVA